MATLKVYLLGKFDILLNGRSITEQLSLSKKSSAVLTYILLNYGNSVTSQQIIDIFWAEEHVSNPESALKTMISRIRDRMAKADPELANCIVAERGSYRWNTRILCEVDVVLFERLCAQSFGAEDENASEMYARIAEIYVGDLVPISLTDNWLIESSIFLHNLYLRAMHRYIRVLKAMGDYEQILHAARSALEIDSFDEGLHLEYMEALKATGNDAQAVAHYRHVTNLFYKYLGSEPTERLLSYYEELTRATLAQQTDLHQVRNKLTDVSQTSGAFVCDYSIFEKIYQLQLRNFERLGIQTCIALFTIDGIEGNDLLLLDQAMEDLSDVLAHSLRKGDTIARYSANQYVVLLPHSNDGFRNVLSARIKKAFFAKRHMECLLSVQLLPLGGERVAHATEPTTREGKSCQRLP